MSDLPRIDTPEDILRNIEYSFNEDKKLTEKQIKSLISLKAGDVPLLEVKNTERAIFLEVVDMLNNIGFDESYKYLKSKQKEENKYEIIRKSPQETLQNARVRYFLDMTFKLRESSKGVKGLYTCPKCKSKNTVTMSVMTRRADEPLTEKSECLTCGTKW